MVPNFIFGCASAWLIKGLDSGINGVVGLGRTRIGFPTQLSSRFGWTFCRKFALCLPSSTSKSNGIVVFGDARYMMYKESPPRTISLVLLQSQLTKNPLVKLTQPCYLLTRMGFGGTKISTVKPYDVLESSIYNLVTENFAKELEAMNVARVAPMTPFTECFSTKNLKYNLVGVEVPNIGFVFENKDVYWELHGANLMVEISREVVCLGLLDGGLNPRTSIVIGAHQLEDNLLQFDLAASKLGFTSTLLEQEVECANFIIVDLLGQGERVAALWRAMYATRCIRDDSVPCQIEEGLYLGSVGGANNKSGLKSLNVVPDREDVNIAQYFDECFNFIDEAKRTGGGVLVHCFVGRSRSVTIVVAYLMKKHNMSASEALDLVRSKRPMASPNSGFMLQLQNYEKSLRGSGTNIGRAHEV
ncbi:unnamed protein product [Camellia sinensis]